MPVNTLNPHPTDDLHHTSRDIGVFPTYWMNPDRTIFMNISSKYVTKLQNCWEGSEQGESTGFGEADQRIARMGHRTR